MYKSFIIKIIVLCLLTINTYAIEKIVLYGDSLMAGYGLPNEEFPFLPQDGKVCFWGGWGGSLIVNDVDNGLTVSYMMNKMMQTVVGDTRGLSILEAAYDSIK